MKIEGTCLPPTLAGVLRNETKRFKSPSGVWDSLEHSLSSSSIASEENSANYLISVDRKNLKGREYLKERVVDKAQQRHSKK